MTTKTSALPTEAKERKEIPLVTGLLDYFPAALAAVAAVSKAGNDQHNPGQPLHWSRGKSGDHADCAGRHIVDRGKIDKDGHRHTAKAAWRLLAELQEELEREEGAPMPRGARVDPRPPTDSSVRRVRLIRGGYGTGGSNDAEVKEGFLKYDVVYEVARTYPGINGVVDTWVDLVGTPPGYDLSRFEEVT